MKIIDHGTWVPYKPEKPPKDAPLSAIYMRRESDGVDWYDYVRPNFLLTLPPPLPTYHPTTGEVLPDDKPVPVPNFKPGSLVCNVYHHKRFDKHIVGTAHRDPTAVMPVNQRVIEITGFNGNDPHAEFGGKVYDHAAGTFTELVLPTLPTAPWVQTILDRLDNITARLEKIERTT